MQFTYMQFTYLTKPLNQNRMNSKQKANDIYKSSMFLHGIEEAKLRALQTVQTVKCLVPYDQKKYWLEVEKQIELK